MQVSEDNLSRLRNALRPLNDAIWSKDDLDAAAITVDVVASVLAEVLEMGSQLSNATDVFSSLVQHGLSERAEGYASDLLDIASLKIYDDDEASESKLEGAEATRELLYGCLERFVERLGERD